MWSFYEYDNVMQAPDRYVSVRYPARHSPMWADLGLRPQGARAWRHGGRRRRAGTGRVGSCRSPPIPNFRGYTDGTQKILWNAIYGSNPSFKAKVAATAAQRRAAEKAASQLRTYANRMVVTVRASVAGEVAQMFGKVGRGPQATKLGRGIVQFRIPMASAEESPIAARLVARLKTLGDNVLAVRLP